MCIRDRREVTQRSLEKERYVVEIAADYRTALQKIEDYDYAVSYTHLLRTYLIDSLSDIYNVQACCNGKEACIIVKEFWPEPVSYTHLDVYKRQSRFSAIVCDGESQLYIFNIGRGNVCACHADSFGPVSYTHL